MRHGHPPKSTPFHSTSPTASNGTLQRMRLPTNSLKVISAFFFATENHDPITKLSRIIQKHKLGKCVSWSNLPKKKETSAANLTWLCTYPPSPAPSALLRDRNLNCKQPLTIYFYLTMPSFCLQEHPNHSRFLRTVNRVPILSLSLFWDHKWRWSH